MIIISLGLAKTGTTSLHHACRMLGLRSVHSVPVGTLISMRVREGVRPSEIDQFDAIFEVDQSLFRAFDRMFPEAYFLFSNRDVEARINSLLLHRLHKRVTGHPGGREIDTRTERVRHEWHETEVREYFSGNPRFLEMDVSAGEGWEAICPWLGLPIPDAPFPRENTGRDKLREILEVWSS